ncbi:MAG: hypothetical protein WCP97_01555 [bacterium]
MSAIISIGVGLIFMVFCKSFSNSIVKSKWRQYFYQAFWGKNASLEKYRKFNQYFCFVCGFILSVFGLLELLGIIKTR